MFSIEKPLEPLSSASPNSQLQLVVSEQETKSDERNSDSERIIDSQKPDDAIDLVDSPPTPNFSIRDYAYKSRSESIETSWPFKPKFLKLCLKNGVRQLLPPFEPPDLIKTRPINTPLQPDPLISTPNVLNQRGNKSTSDENTPSDTENLPLVAIKDKKKRNKALKKVKKIKISRELQEKKCSKLVVKLGNLEIGSNNLITDPMASKICPVCKTFSSSSNTTLNAHIDQCLSTDSNTKLVENDTLKPKIKPRKKKLLSEIYETALLYTLEDLDRRNGTNWALSAVPSLSVEDPKSEKPKPDKGLNVEDSCRGKERGAVYVDSNGIKIRILSKFDDLKEADLVLEEKKKGKGKFGKKKGVGFAVGEKKMKKKMKVEGKKFKPFKGFKTRVQPPRDGKANETQNKNGNGIINEEADLIPSEREKSKNNIISLSNWACAKRSDTPKKRNKKNPYKIMQNSDDSPSTSSQIPKFSNSKSSSSSNTLRLKLPRQNSKRDEANCGKIAEMGSKNIDFCSESLEKLQNGPTLRSESVEAQVPLSRKFKKHISVLKMDKKAGTFPSNSCSSRVLHEEPDEDIIAHVNKRLKFTQCNNNNIFEAEVEYTPDREEITENTGGQDENSPNQETQLEIIDPSKDLSSEFLLPTNNENVEVINAPQIGHNGNNDEDDDVIETRDDTSLDTPQDDSSITSNWDEELNLERSLATFADVSESPNSTASTMSLSSKEPVLTQLDPLSKDPLTFSPPMDLDFSVKSATGPKKIEEIADKPFVCSCRENLSKEAKNVILPKGKQLPPLYIGPRDLVPYRPDPLIGTGFDSPSQSFSTLSQCPVPASPSNPILRLMGKNLLVVNQEEITVPPLTPSSSSSFQSRTGFLPPPNGVLNQNFPYQSQSNPYQPLHRSEINRQMAASPYLPKEVIVIDDSPELDSAPAPVSVSVPMPPQQNISILGSPMMQQRPFFCYPTQNGTAGTVLYPQVGTGYFTQVGPTVVHEPGPFIFRPPTGGYLDPSLYYSHTMR